MDIKVAFSFFIITSCASLGWARLQRVNLNTTATHHFNVEDYGAVGDGQTDDSGAFFSTWIAACSMPGYSIIITVPWGKTFLLSPLTFLGPCYSTTINFQILGNILAPNHITAWNDIDLDRWIVFDSIDGLMINGSGQIDGNGWPWWKCRQEQICPQAPASIRINYCNNFSMSEIKFVNSPKMHLILFECTTVHISKIMITAPEDSPNTDGVHLQSCKYVNITDSIIGTGDDCISIGNNTSNVNITGIFCGPGHGISIGSLGKDMSYAAVEQIHVSNCIFRGTMNGMRIKTWQGGSGYARGITFENMSVTSVDHPIVIDQYYCNGDHGCANKTSAVEVSDVRFTSVSGSSSREVAITLACSETVACKDIHLENIILTTIDHLKEPVSACTNAHGTVKPPVIPEVPCLS